MKKLILLIILMASFLFSQGVSTYKPYADNWLYASTGAVLYYYNVADSTFYPVTGDTTTQGTRISNKKVGGTGFKENIGGMANQADEIILKENTTYQRIFISGSDDNVISFRAMWVED